MGTQAEATKEYALESIIATAIKAPGVKVNREDFLKDAFSKKPELLRDILDYGPVEAGCSREELSGLANRLILIRTSVSSAASFMTGLPGGWAMVATIPADVMQFFGMSLRLAQEISYLYGAQDLWNDGVVDDDRVRSQLLLYCGVMFGVSGATAGVRILSKQIAKTTLRKLPQKALTKTFWFPIVQKIGKALSIKVTKSTVAHGVSKAIPVIGGVVSGGLNFASMMPMAKRLYAAFDSASFNYTDADLEADIKVLEEADDNDAQESGGAGKLKDNISKGIKKVGAGISGVFSKRNNTPNENETRSEDVFEYIEKLARLRDDGLISEEEYSSKKTELLSRL